MAEELKKNREIQHEEDVKNYTVVRHVQFYAKSERVSLNDLRKFFTLQAIASYIKYGYLVRDSTTIKPN